MSDTNHRIPQNEVLRADALAWLRRLNNGEATAADAEELEKWRATSPAHAHAFAEASLLWNVLGDAARMAEDSHAGGAAAPETPTAHSRIGRRALLGAGGALAASVAAVLVVRPPLELWPSFSELTADYRTGTGQRRQIELAARVSVDLNTRTSLDLRPAIDGGAQIELLAGEAAIAKRDDVSGELVVIAGTGRATAASAAFNIRKDGGSVGVTCLDGDVQVRCRGVTAAIRRGQQISYNERGLGQVVAIDPEVVSAWQQGLLIFRRASLAHVIAEVNRYRSGRIVLLDAELGRRQVVANFRLDRIDDVIDFVAKAMNIPTRSLPGGIVLVG